jgi:nucleotide-binding universal stress UspA family protein
MKYMYKKILVPYDISMPADKALEHAVKLAKAIKNRKAEVILLHVIAELPLYPLLEMKASTSPPRTASLIEHIGKVHDETGKYIAQMIEKKRKRYVSSGITFRSVVLKGIPVKKILEYAEKEKVDLIIIGSLGWGEISKSNTLGSVARGVVERAHCPVTVDHQ